MSDPQKRIYRLMSPFEQRMSDLASRHNIPEPGSPEAHQLQKLMDMDVGFQIQLKSLGERIQHLLIARSKGGSGLQISKLLRSYFSEYADRYLKHGPRYFPTSFNVVESFLNYDRSFHIFDLRPEIEHLLSINDYFRWYQENPIRKTPRVLEEIMKEGVIYSYDMVADTGSFRIVGTTQQVFAATAFVRHKHEVSCLLLAGENPPPVSDQEVVKMMKEDYWTARPRITPDPTFTTNDRYLDGYPGFSKIIVLTRLDLREGKHDVRYVLQDLGPSFKVLTDDSPVLFGRSAEETKRLRLEARSGLAPYDDLFSALSSLIYLPAFYAESPQAVSELIVSTDLHAMRDDSIIRKTVALLGKSECPDSRTIHCLPNNSDEEPQLERTIDPPELQFKNDGYWKAIGPLEVGEGKDGERMMGRTWVSRHETWSAQSPKAFLIARKSKDESGVDPGIIYVQRSPGHEPNLYKIGLTRREPKLRAKELSSSTSAPLPFAVLASWEVGDCARVEKIIHDALAAHRVNPRREFFLADLALIVRTISQLIEKTDTT